jgi:hypothetical protein
MASHLPNMLLELPRALDSASDSLLKCISDPLRALGALCGMDDLTTNADGYCSLMLDYHRVVHLARRPGCARITLSVSLSGRAGSRLPAGVHTMPGGHASEIRTKLLSDASVCAQLVFEGQGASGEALLAAIDRLLAYAEEWDDAAAAVSFGGAGSVGSLSLSIPTASLPFSRVIDSGFSSSVKRRSRCA